MSPRGVATAEPVIANPISRLKVDLGPVAALGIDVALADLAVADFR
jgi:hypothetical protein